MPAKRLIVLFIGFVVFSALKGIDWAQVPLDDPTQAQFLSFTRLPLSSPLIVENGAVRPDASPLKSSLFFNFGQNDFAIKTSVFEKPSGSAEAGNFAGEAGKRDGLQALATGALFERNLVTEGELAYGPFDPKSLQGLGDSEHRLLRLAVKSAWGDLGYGAEYRVVGKRYINLFGPQIGSDQEGGEIWTERKFGVVGLKTSLSQFTDNIEKDPLSPRITKTQAGATLSFAPPSWPSFSLSYYRGFSSSSEEPSGFQPRRGSLETLGASVDYHASAWDARVSSSYALSNDRSLPSFSAGSYSLSPPVQTETPSVALGVTYRLLPGALTLATGGSYSEMKSSDGLLNESALNASTSLMWNVGNSSLGNQTLSLEAMETRHLDGVYPGNSHKDMAVRFVFKIGFM